MKNKLKSYKFWLALLAAVIVLINTLGAVFHFSVNEVAITSIVTAVLGIFVTLGLIKKDTEEENKNQEQINSLKENDKNTEDKNNNEDNNL